MNKPIPLSFFLHFIFINSVLLSLATAEEEAVAVLDGVGDAVEVGSQYYIKSVATGDSAGGGVTIGYSGAQRCPLTVFQEILNVQNGVPCSFHPANPKESVVHISSSLNIKFEAHIGCAESSVWQVGEYDEMEGFYPILIGGKEGEPGCSTLTNWFKIEKGDSGIDRSYKLVFDPTDVCPNSEKGFSGIDRSYKLVFDPTDVCLNSEKGFEVGVLFREGKRPLALNGSAVEVKFWKHNRYSSAI